MLSENPAAEHMFKNSSFRRGVMNQWYITYANLYSVPWPTKRIDIPDDECVDVTDPMKDSLYNTGVCPEDISKFVMTNQTGPHGKYLINIKDISAHFDIEPEAVESYLVHSLRLKNTGSVVSRFKCNYTVFSY
jgi:hypothetical protein